MSDLIVKTVTSEGRSTKEVLQEMARNFADPMYRSRVNFNGTEGDWVMFISAELADQLAEFFNDMAESAP